MATTTITTINYIGMLVFITALSLSEVVVVVTARGLFPDLRGSGNGGRSNTIQQQRFLADILVGSSLDGCVYEESNTGCSKCLEFYYDEKPTSHPTVTWDDDAPQCPCSKQDAENDPSWWKSNWRLDRFHPGSTNCYRKDFISTIDGLEHKHQCCYDEEDKLIVNGQGAGTMDYARLNNGHFSKDIDPWKACCNQCQSGKFVSFVFFVLV